MGGGVFDGACQTQLRTRTRQHALSKQYNLYSKIDTEAERYWLRGVAGRVCPMNVSEMQFIVDELLGNTAARSPRVTARQWTCATSASIVVFCRKVTTSPHRNRR
jgi:hypothetical protein